MGASSLRGDLEDGALLGATLWPLLKGTAGLSASTIGCTVMVAMHIEQHAEWRCLLDASVGLVSCYLLARRIGRLRGNWSVVVEDRNRRKDLISGHTRALQRAEQDWRKANQEIMRLQPRYDRELKKHLAEVRATEQVADAVNAAKAQDPDNL